MLAIFKEWHCYRELFWNLVQRDVRVRYKGSLFGIVWTLINPLMQLAVYTLVFATILKSPVKHYGPHLFCALLPWTWFAGSLTAATGSIIANAGLVRKVYFPTELLPLVPVFSHGINFILSLPVLLGLLCWHGLVPNWTILALPLVMALQALLTCGLGLMLALVTPFVRDTEYLLGVVLMLGFYLTPILYPSEILPTKYAFVLQLNPMTPLVSAYRGILYDGHFAWTPGLSYATLFSLIVFFGALLLFNRNKFYFAEVV